jgi:dihydropyrimidinase
MEGSKYVCSPPPRDVDSQLACWEGLQQGVFEVFSSDHCPYRYEDEAGKTNTKGKTSFRYVPNGIPGIATRMPILFSEGVVKGRISLNRFVALTSTNHAKRYGLYPRKGTIAVGSDADLVLWDDRKKVTITHDLLQDGCDYTPYEGMEVTGWPVRTIMKGRTIMENGVVAKRKYGTQLKRTLPRLKTF